MIEVGDAAPDFELPDQDGQLVRLSSLRGRPVVLYFYPRADTPGCTAQACGVRDRRFEYAAAAAAVLGVSPDSVAAIKRFHDRRDLNFTLLADEDHAVAERYGTWTRKSLFGKAFLGVARTTFIIDAEGRVATVLRRVSPKTHDDVVLAALADHPAAA